jgi:hypothetical protein
MVHRDQTSILNSRIVQCSSFDPPVDKCGWHQSRYQVDGGFAFPSLGGAAGMHTLRYKGFTVAAEHPALWVDKGDRIVRDLVEVLTRRSVTLDCLRHLIASRERLIGGHYHLPGNKLIDTRGCLMFVLTEPLGERQIRSKFDLTRFFGREQGLPAMPGYVAAKDSPEYQPAKWLVRLVDGQFCENVRARYGRACELFDYDLVLVVAAQVLVQRELLRLPAPLAVELAAT